MLTILEACSGA